MSMDEVFQPFPQITECDAGHLIEGPADIDLVGGASWVPDGPGRARVAFSYGLVCKCGEGFPFSPEIIEAVRKVLPRFLRTAAERRARQVG